MSNKLPSTEQMLEDLSKVKGLEFFWTMIGAALGANVLTPKEEEIVKQMQSPAAK